MNKFVEFYSYNGGLVRVGTNAPCQIKGKWSITFDGKTNTKDVYFVDDKYNILSVGQLADKGYLLQFIEKACIIKDKDCKFIVICIRIRGNIFQLNPTEMTCLVAKVDDGYGKRDFFILILITLWRYVLHMQ